MNYLKEILHRYSLIFAALASFDVAQDMLCGRYSAFRLRLCRWGVMWSPSMSRSLQTMSGAVLQYDIVSGFQWRRQVGFAKHLPQIYFRGPAHL